MQTSPMTSEYSVASYEPQSLGPSSPTNQSVVGPSQAYSLPFRYYDSAPMTPIDDLTSRDLYYYPLSPRDDLYSDSFRQPISGAASIMAFCDPKSVEMYSYPQMAPSTRIFTSSDSLETSHDELSTPVSIPDESLYYTRRVDNLFVSDFELPRLASSGSDSTDSEDDALDIISVSPRSVIRSDSVLMFDSSFSSSLMSPAPSPVVARISSNICSSPSVPEVPTMQCASPMASSLNEGYGAIVRDCIQRRGRKPSLVEDPSKAFVCAHCNRRFRRHEHLKRHFRSLHTREKPFRCEECSKSFSRSDNLAQHIRTHARGGRISSADDNDFDNDSDNSDQRSSSRGQRSSTSATSSPNRRRAGQLSTTRARSGGSRHRTGRSSK
ncbi:hypothetical protein POJ06DRAFT_116876 [Lipomyces tetrasporus]|uniref:C2H2-type domain-containing protein n=1 Tax=Lipomyces tetrasporus TaxID=54092 RepID=A0AAD7QU65_9ASCO|nr:uncharacterized protein POJ06DRAFT_116876 [Lipomyces tetrasporus]KAJ8099797.1 hypothetical protein POJ06DRAFT_116876 [Lipomyces tetrasporus]